MDFEQVNNLKKDKKTGLYDITKSVYTYKDNIAIYPYVVEKEDEMRMDLISYKLYKTTEHTAFLCRLNNIINPLNIKDNTLLIYTDESEIQSFTPPNDSFVEEVKQVFININKKRRIDANREKYNKKKDSDITLPPVFKENNKSDVILDKNGILTIRPTGLQ